MYEQMVVAVGGKRWSLPMAQVVEVVGLQHTTPVPLGPRALLGLMHLRGQIILVVDLHAALLGEEPGGATLPDEPLLVVRTAETTIGLRVDEVLGPGHDDSAQPIDLSIVVGRLREE